MLKLKGTYTAMITPMKKNGAVDFEGFRKHVKNQLKAGIDGLVPLCTTSETPTLDEDEEDKMLDIIMEERAAYKKSTGKNVPIIVGTGTAYNPYCYLDENGKQLPLGSVSGTIYFTKKGE